MRWWSLRFLKPTPWSDAREARAAARPGRGENGRTAARRLPPQALIAGLLLVLLHVALFRPASRADGHFPRQGEIAARQIVAPFDFQAPLPEAEVELKRLDCALTEPPVVRRAPQPRGTSGLDRLAAWRADLRAQRARLDVPFEERLNRLTALYPELGRDDLRRVLGARDVEDLLRAMEEALREVLDAGLVDVLPAGRFTQIHVAGSDTEATLDASAVHVLPLMGERLPYLLRAHGLDATAAGRAASLLAPFAAPNLIYDATETRARQESARAAVPAHREFSRGERIVDQGVRVSAQDELFLSHLQELLAERGGLGRAGPTGGRLLAHALLLAAALLAYGWFATIYFPLVLTRPRFLWAVFTILGLFLAGAALSLSRPALGVWGVPIALLALMTTVLFRDRVGGATTLLGVALLATIPGLAAWAGFVWAVLGVVTVAQLRDIQQRGQFYRTIAILCGLSLLLIVAQGAAEGASLKTLGVRSLVGLCNPVAAIALALFLLPIVEPVIGVASDLTLLELADLNHPLLKEMALESQGTYHHSQVVSQLAEQAARAVGANALLTRVGALFHDIGKLAKPDYFVENQRGGVNRHDELSPRMSALVVASHVKEGIELGRRWRLPQAVIDFIPEHHGTSVMEYFYHKALEADNQDTVKVDDFRYPGPKPHCRETAILMLADAVEAAARSLAKPTPGRLREVTKQVIDRRLLSGELDDAPLTMADLARVREAFVLLLTGIHHARISYPGQRERDAARGGERSEGRGREGPRPSAAERGPGG